MLSKIQRDTLSKTVTAFRALSLALTSTINTSISPLSETQILSAVEAIRRWLNQSRELQPHTVGSKAVPVTLQNGSNFNFLNYADHCLTKISTRSISLGKNTVK